MLTHPTLDQLRTLKLDGMAAALEEQRQLPACNELAFEDRLGLLVDRERAWRDGRRLERLLRAAKLKHAQAGLEDVQYSAGRGLDKRLIATLSGGDWIRQGQSILLTGATGVGKT
jgi:DNA replication protein DnaC